MRMHIHTSVIVLHVLHLRVTPLHQHRNTNTRVETVQRRPHAYQETRTCATPLHALQLRVTLLHQLCLLCVLNAPSACLGGGHCGGRNCHPWRVVAGGSHMWLPRHACIPTSTQCAQHLAQQRCYSTLRPTVNLADIISHRIQRLPLARLR